MVGLLVTLYYNKLLCFYGALLSFLIQFLYLPKLVKKYKHIRSIGEFLILLDTYKIFKF